MMRKFRLFAVFVLLALVLSAGSSAVLAQQPPPVTELEGATYLNVPGEQWGGPTTEAALRINQIDVQDADLGLFGEVQYSDAVYPIHLTGAFYTSRLGQAGDKVAVVEDQSQNFKVLHLAVRRNPPVEAFLVNKKALHGPVVFLYLQRIGTREVTLIEASITSPKLKNALVPLLGRALERGTFGSDYWPHKLFEPTPVGNAEEGATVGILAEQDVTQTTYSEFYDIGNGCWEEYNIKFQAYASGPSDIAQGDGEFNHQVEILDKWTDSNCAFYQSDTSPFQLGTGDDPVHVKLRAYGNGSDTGDVFLKGKWSSTAFEEEGWFPGEVTISVGLAYKIASVSWSYTLCCETGVGNDDWLIFSQEDPDEWTKLTDHAYKDRYLRNEGQHFWAIVQYAWGTGSRYQKDLDARWKVPIYGDDGGYRWYGDTYYLYTTLNYYSG